MVSKAICWTLRLAARLGLGAALLMASSAAASSASQAGFEAWIKTFKTQAARSGKLDRAMLDRAFKGVKLSEKALELDKDQPEFTLPVWGYLDRLGTDKRITEGKAAMSLRASVLADIEQRYGVPASVVGAIWGVESNFGEIRGDFDVIATLASLAYSGRAGKNGSRRKFWRRELTKALEILAAGDVVDRATMKGSWAGAMGHTQFIPSSFDAYAVDFGGDGRRDVWTDDPTDSLASTANYLKTFGWKTGEPWGLKVRLPKDFNYALLGAKRPVGDWASVGVTLADGAALPTGLGEAELMLPAGHRGEAFLTLQNFRSIMRYNNSTSYALAISLLSERLAGAPAAALNWPTDDRPLKREERKELQRKLTALGFDTHGVDGILGNNSKAAIRRFQGANSMIADGYPSANLLGDVRRALDARNAPVLASAAGPADTEDVREIQVLLNGLGYDTGGVDGEVGSMTRRAIESFVTARNADLPAEPSKQLLAELRRAVRGD